MQQCNMGINKVRCMHSPLTAGFSSQRFSSRKTNGGGFLTVQRPLKTIIGKQKVVLFVADVI